MTVADAAADLDCDADIDAFCLRGRKLPSGAVLSTADFNGDRGCGDDADIEPFSKGLAGGTC